MPASLPARLFRTITAFVVIFQLAAGMAMAASADLHHHLHDHSHDPAHECVVTLILQGGCDVAGPEIVPVDAAPRAAGLPPVLPGEMQVAAAHLAGGVLAHAPPRGP